MRLEQSSTPKGLDSKAQGKRSATLGTVVNRIPTLKGLHTQSGWQHLWNPFRVRILRDPLTQGDAALTLGSGIEPFQGSSPPRLVRRRGSALLVAALLALVAFSASGKGVVAPQDMPGPLKEVGFDQHLGDKLPLDAVFVDETGENVTLGDYFGDKPVVLAFVYYDCPMLCPMVLEGVAKTLGVLKFDAGEDFDVVSISIDPRETPYMAASQKLATVKRYGREGTARGWHFLTGTAESVERVTEAAGFRYAYIEENDEFAHASGMVVATPDGTLSQYFYGLDFSPKDVRLSLVEASEGQIGSVVDQILLYCFRYDPELGKYTAVVTRVLRLTALVFLAVLGSFLWIMWRRDRIAARTAALGAASR